MTFEDWLNEIENYSCRQERILTELDDCRRTGILLSWLRAAYDVGYEHALHRMEDDLK